MFRHYALSSYALTCALVKEQVEVVVISAPGRERRVAEAAHISCEALVAEVAEALQASGLVDDVPYAFFGHSLGSLVALETARPLASEIIAAVIGSCRQLSFLSRLEARVEYVRTRRLCIGSPGVTVALALAVGSLLSASSLASDAEAPGRTDGFWPSSAHPHLRQRPRLAEHGSGDRRTSSAHRAPW